MITKPGEGPSRDLIRDCEIIPNLRLTSGKCKQGQFIAAFLLTFCTFALIPAAEDVYLPCLVWAMQRPGHYASKYPDRQMVTWPGLDNRSWSGGMQLHRRDSTILIIYYYQSPIAILRNNLIHCKSQKWRSQVSKSSIKLLDRNIHTIYYWLLYDPRNKRWCWLVMVDIMLGCLITEILQGIRLSRDQSCGRGLVRWYRVLNRAWNEG